MVQKRIKYFVATYVLVSQDSRLRVS